MLRPAVLQPGASTAPCLRYVVFTSASTGSPHSALHCRFLDEYDLKVPSGSFKYKKAAEFLMNTIISGLKGIVKDIVGAKDTAAARASAAEASVTQVGWMGVMGNVFPPTEAKSVGGACCPNGTAAPGGTLKAPSNSCFVWGGCADSPAPHVHVCALWVCPAA